MKKNQPPMRVEIINTGTELMLGQVVNTHLAYLGERLFELELRVNRQVCVPDGEPIRGALAEAFSRNEIVLVTGGLGPTSDDVTREITAEFCGLELELNDEALRRIEKRLSRVGVPMKKENRRQAMAPAGATVLQNEHGTAPGLYLPAAIGRPHVFLLPGPPRELHPMFEKQVMPMLKDIVGLTEERICRNYRIFGVGESNVAAVLEEKLKAIAEMEHGYCVKAGEVILRCIAPENALSEVDALVDGHFRAELVSTDDTTLEEVVVELLAARKETLAVAESCTGGQIAHLVTNVPGASEVFMEGLTTYANAAKIRLLGVDEAMLKQHGAVSREVAAAMAAGCRNRAGVTHALSTTGIAGPTGGTREKPVGTVFIGMSSEGREVEVQEVHYPSDRMTFKEIVARKALDALRRRLK